MDSEVLEGSSMEMENDGAEMREEETEEEYRMRVYGTTDNGAASSSIPSSERKGLVRSKSGRLVREIARRSSSIISEAVPETPKGWVIFLSTVATMILGHEINLQSKLTGLPTVFGQCVPSNDRDADRLMVEIYNLLTAKKELSILARTIRPSLFVGTRSIVASTAAYALGGPTQDGYVRFREVFTMTQDNAQIVIDWELPNQKGEPELRKQQILHGPIQEHVVVILHGINNDATFGYMRSLMRAVSRCGWIAVGVNFRGCSHPLRTPRGYTGAFTGDLRNVIWRISSRLQSGVKVFLVGNSLGANIMTKYLGEESLGETLPECVSGGISLGNPLQLSGRKIKFPWNVILAVGVKKAIAQNWTSIRQMKDPFYQDCLRKSIFARTISEFDEATTPLSIRNNPFYPFDLRIGYQNADDYWHDGSSHRYIREIKVPFLVLASEDDFLVHHGAMSKLSLCLANPNVIVVNTRCGGHLGWQECPPDTGSYFGFGTSWADTATTDFIKAVLQARENPEPLHRAQREARERMKGHAMAKADSFQSRL